MQNICTYLKKICRFVQQKRKDMTSEMKPTGQQIKYENGKVFNIYSKMTKKGVRYYRWSLGRFFPISEMEINNYILIY